MAKIAMVFPDPKSEKGISSYSLNLIEKIKEFGTNIEEIKFTQGKSWTLFRQLLKLKKYNIIHIQHEYNLLGGYGIPYFILLCLLGVSKKKGIIVTMHTVLSQNEKFQSGKLKTILRKILYKFQNKWISFTSAKIIVHSEAFKRVLVDEYHIKQEKVIVLPHAIMENVKLIEKSKAKRELSLSGNIYLMIGTMVPDHGQDIIVKQADKIGKTILVATNPTAVNYRNEERIKNFLNMNQEIVKDNGFDKYVRFDLGQIDNNKWWNYFAASDLILLPYRGGIGSGIFADAMAAQKPVVASNIPYFNEFAKKYKCIKIAKDDNDFARVIKESMESSNYKKMIDGCKKFISDNGLTPIAKKYKELYDSLYKLN